MTQRATALSSAKNFNVRPGMKRLHRFRSNVVAMTTVYWLGERIMVALENGKVYISNKKVTRWRLIRPVSKTTEDK